MIQLKTSGLHFENHVAEQKLNVKSYEEGILVESYCLQQNSKDMWQFWEELFNRVKLTDLKRFETLVKMSATDLTNGIADAGHHYVMNSAGSLVSLKIWTMYLASGGSNSILSCSFPFKKVSEPSK